MQTLQAKDGHMKRQQLPAMMEDIKAHTKNSTATPAELRKTARQFVKVAKELRHLLVRDPGIESWWQEIRLEMRRYDWPTLYMLAKWCDTVAEFLFEVADKRRAAAAKKKKR